MENKKMPKENNTEEADLMLKTIQSLESKNKELEAKLKENQNGLQIDYCEVQGLHIVGPWFNTAMKIADAVADGDKLADRFLTLLVGKLNHAKGTHTGIAQANSGQMDELRDRADYKESTKGLKSVTYKMV
jgi:hypothetical protein